VTSFRAHESYSIFEKRWQLPVYFQLRWKEIVGKLEESLTKIKLEVSHSKGTPFVFSHHDERLDFVARLATFRHTTGFSCLDCDFCMLELPSVHSRAMPTILEAHFAGA
jgi:hypothetical protein